MAQGKLGGFQTPRYRQAHDEGDQRRGKRQSSRQRKKAVTPLIMIRVVLDTNIVVSALLVPTGLEAFVLLLCVRGYIQACFSPALLAEYELVLHRPRLKLPSFEVGQALTDIRSKGRLVHPTETISVSAHEADNRIYECAATAGADYIVTGNKKHFPHAYEGIEVVSARELLERLRHA